MFESFLENYIWTLALLVTLFLIDDLFIDFWAWYKRLGPKPVSKDVLYDENHQAPIAIMVANWQEEDVLEAMVRGNMARLPGNNVHLFLGVYPNDLKTRAIALKLEQEYERVHVVINQKQGPTYKGQMLNEIIDSIFKQESELGVIFEGFVLHDSEDILDPRIPYLYNLGIRQVDFIQTPVLSLKTGWHELCAGTYLDEFSEIHTKDLLVREDLGASIPSAGVGTCLSRRLVLTFLARQGGEVFLPNSLTEDYQLGLQSGLWGFKSKFLCYYLEDETPRDLIATKEFFPHLFWNAVRQKTRWTTGIAFQGGESIGWFGDFWQRYFLWRDRKGPINAFLTLNILAMFIIAPFLNMNDWASSNALMFIFTFNTLGMLFRFVARYYCVKRLYGNLMALGVLLRWPSAMCINMYAGLRSTHQYMESSLTGEQIKWVKTQHRLPENFGENIQIEISKNNSVGAEQKSAISP